MDIQALRHTAKEILAAAALELFPGTQLLGGTVDELGFSYTFAFPSNRLSRFTDQELLHLEDQMIQMIHEDRPVKHLEMMRENAATFLEHLDQPGRGQAALEETQNIVSLIEIGSFRDLCPPPFLAATSELKAFKLQKYESEADGAVRIYGTAFETRQELKTFLKQVKEAAKSDPLILGPREGYFQVIEEEWVYLDKGRRLLQKLRDFWEQAHADFACILIPDHLDPRSVHEALDFPKIASLSLFKGDFVSIKCRNAQELNEEYISSLQFIEKAFNLFPFNRSVRTVEQKVPAETTAFCITDSYGREKTLSVIEVERKKNVLKRSLFYSPREWVAQMIEMGVEI